MDAPVVNEGDGVALKALNRAAEVLQTFVRGTHLPATSCVTFVLPTGDKFALTMDELRAGGSNLGKPNRLHALAAAALGRVVPPPAALVHTATRVREQLVALGRDGMARELAAVVASANVTATSTPIAPGPDAQTCDAAATPRAHADEDDNCPAASPQAPVVILSPAGCMSCSAHVPNATPNASVYLAATPELFRMVAAALRGYPIVHRIRATFTRDQVDGFVEFLKSLDFRAEEVGALLSTDPAAHLRCLRQAERAPSLFGSALPRKTHRAEKDLQQLLEWDDAAGASFSLSQERIADPADEATIPDHGRLSSQGRSGYHAVVAHATVGTPTAGKLPSHLSSSTVVGRLAPFLHRGVHSWRLRCGACEYIGFGVISRHVVRRDTEFHTTAGCAARYMNGSTFTNFPHNLRTTDDVVFSAHSEMGLVIDFEARLLTWIVEASVVSVAHFDVAELAPAVVLRYNSSVEWEKDPFVSLTMPRPTTLTT